jgi:hypothetical protein
MVQRWLAEPGTPLCVSRRNDLVESRAEGLGLGRRRLDAQCAPQRPILWRQLLNRIHPTDPGKPLRQLQLKCPRRADAEECRWAVALPRLDCGADLLSGDLAWLPLLEQRIRDRARADVAARIGIERAREFGW